jgi:hypothetical protein
MKNSSNCISLVGKLVTGVAALSLLISATSARADDNSKDCKAAGKNLAVTGFVAASAGAACGLSVAHGDVALAALSCPVMVHHFAKAHAAAAKVISCRKTGAGAALGE